MQHTQNQGGFKTPILGTSQKGREGKGRRRRRRRRTKHYFKVGQGNHPQNSFKDSEITKKPQKHQIYKNVSYPKNMGVKGVWNWF